jgi:hypothetical protein
MMVRRAWRVVPHVLASAVILAGSFACGGIVVVDPSPSSSASTSSAHGGSPTMGGTGGGVCAAFCANPTCAPAFQVSCTECLGACELIFTHFPACASRFNAKLTCLAATTCATSPACLSESMATAACCASNGYSNCEGKNGDTTITVGAGPFHCD